MSEVANIADAAIRRAANSQVPEDVAVHVFRVMHAAFGNLFLSRFVTGQVEDGEDKGVKNARRMWAYALRDFDVSTVKAALARVLDGNGEYPPTLPQLRALCVAAAPRVASQEVHPKAIGMGDKLRSEYARRSREIIARHEEKRIQRLAGYRELPLGLDGLKAAIADAVACAGGNEAAELLRLDRLFSKAAA